MKLSELHYIQLLDETRQALVVGDDTAFTYLMEVRHRLAAGKEAIKKVAELEKEAEHWKQTAGFEADGLESWKKEAERLTFLHNLDHSLADQWQEKNEMLLATLEIKNTENTILKQQVAAGQRAIESIKQWILFCEQEKYNKSFCLTEIIKIVDAVQQSKEAGE
jgi:hypothetical protein